MNFSFVSGSIFSSLLPHDIKIMAIKAIEIITVAITNEIRML
jgi:hypothetical protein